MNLPKSYYRFENNCLRLHVHLQPNAKKNAIDGIHGDALKIRLAAPPIDGKANEALIDFLAKQCDIPKRSISIEHGKHSRKKWIKLINPKNIQQLINYD